MLTFKQKPGTPDFVDLSDLIKPFTSLGFSDAFVSKTPVLSEKGELQGKRGLKRKGDVPYQKGLKRKGSDVPSIEEREIVKAKRKHTRATLSDADETQSQNIKKGLKQKGSDVPLPVRIEQAEGPREVVKAKRKFSK